jgi:hypothetical protein
VVALFTCGWGKVKIQRPYGNSGDDVLPVKGRATAHFHLTAWLGWRLDGMSCHWWMITCGTLDVRQSARGMEGSSGDGRGMRPRRAPTWRRQPCGGGAWLQCSAGRRTAQWEKWPTRCSEARAQHCSNNVGMGVGWGSRWWPHGGKDGGW